MPSLREARHRIAAHYLGTARAVDGLYKQGGEALAVGLTIFDNEWHNIRGVYAWVSARADEDAAAASFCKEYADALAHVLTLRLSPRERLRWRESALTAARRLNDRHLEGVNLVNLANVYDDLGENRRAVELYETALEIKRELHDREGEGLVKANLGATYLRLKEPQRAIRYLEAAAGLLGLGLPDPGVVVVGDGDDERGHLAGRVWSNLGSAYLANGDAERAAGILQKALVVAMQSGDPIGCAHALTGLGRTFKAVGEIGRAVEHFEKALAVARRIGHRQIENALLLELSDAYAATGGARRALDIVEHLSAATRAEEGAGGASSLRPSLDQREAFEKILRLARAAGDRRLEAQVLDSIGEAYRHAGEPGRSVEFIRQALDIFVELGERSDEAKALGNMGITYKHLGQLERALEYFRRQEELVRSAGDRKALANVLVNMGNVRASMNEMHDATEFYEQGVAIFREAGDAGGEAKALLNLGAARQMSGEIKHAANLYTRSLELADGCGDHSTAGNALYNLATFFLNAGRREEGASYLRQAADRFVRAGLPLPARLSAALKATRRS